MQTNELNSQRTKTKNEKSKFQEFNKEKEAEQEEKEQEEQGKNNIEFNESYNIENNNVIIDSSILEKKEKSFQVDYREINFVLNQNVTPTSKKITSKSIVKNINNRTNIDHNGANDNIIGNSVQAFLPEASASSNNINKYVNPDKDANNNFYYKNNDNFSNNIYKNTYFTSIGVFFLENSDKTKKIYFNIFHRKIELQAGNLIENFFFQDITDLVNYQINQFQESIKKQKLYFV